MSPLYPRVVRGVALAAACALAGVAGAQDQPAEAPAPDAPPVESRAVEAPPTPPAPVEAKRVEAKADTPAAPAAPPAAVAAPAFPPDALVVVINDGLPRSGKLDAAGVRAIFLGTRQHWPDGRRIQAVQRPARSQAGAAFFDRILDMSPSAYKRRWQKKLLSGRGVAPRTAGSAMTVLSAVARSRAAIGYVLGSELRGPVPGVKLIEVKP